MKATEEQLDDVRQHVGQSGYPGGCAVCKGFNYPNPGHRQPQGPDMIICILCGETDKSAYHNHVVCKDCGG